MGAHREHHLESVSRREVLAGPTGQRCWSDATKGRIIAESLGPDVTVRSVAERYGLKPNHLSSWRARAGGQAGGFGFCRCKLCDGWVADPLPPPVTLDRIELVVGGITLRLDAATPPSRIAELAAALWAAL